MPTPLPENDWLRDRSCTNKVPHQSRGEAKQAAKDMMRHKGRGTLGPYSCPYCDRWHVGHLVSPKTLRQWRKAGLR